MVNRYTDARLRKTPCSISLPNEMWGKIDEYIHGANLNRSEFFEILVRQALETKGKESTEESGLRTSVSTILRSIHRIKDFIATNSREHMIGNLEAVRREIVEAAAFIEQEISRSRTPTKRDRKESALKQAIAAHRARIDNNGIVMNAPPFQDTKGTKEEEKEKEKDPVSQGLPEKQEPELDPVELEFERIRKEEYAGYKEEPLPKPDFEIVDEGRTKRNTFNNDNEEILE